MKYYGFVTDFLVTYLIIILYLGIRAQIEPVDGSSRFMAHTTSFRQRTVLLGVVTIVEFTWGNSSQKLPQNGR